LERRPDRTDVLALLEPIKIEPIKNFHSQNQKIKCDDIVYLGRRNRSETARPIWQPLPTGGRTSRCTLILPATKALPTEPLNRHSQSRVAHRGSAKPVFSNPSNPHTEYRRGRPRGPGKQFC
jgi:hypothetical protein